MSDEQPERYIVTDELLEDLIYRHQEITRCSFQRYSTANAELSADKALKACKKIVVPYWATHFAAMKLESTSVGMRPWYYNHEEIPS